MHLRHSSTRKCGFAVLFLQMKLQARILQIRVMVQMKLQAKFLRVRVTVQARNRLAVQAGFVAIERTAESVFFRSRHTMQALEMDFVALFIKKGLHYLRLGFFLAGRSVFIVLRGLTACAMREGSDAVSFAQRRCAHNAGYFQRPCCGRPKSSTRALAVWTHVRTRSACNTSCWGTYSKLQERSISRPENTL